MIAAEIAAGALWVTGIAALGVVTARSGGTVSALLLRGALLLGGLELAVAAAPVAARTPLMRFALALATAGALAKILSDRRAGRSTATLRFPPFWAALLLAVGGLRFLALAFCGPIDTIDYRSHYALRSALLVLSPSGAASLFDRFATPWHGFYPPALSFLYAALRNAAGVDSDRLTGLVPALGGVLLVLAVGEALARLRVRPLPAALWSAALVLSGGLFATTEIGHAETWLAAALAVVAGAILDGVCEGAPGEVLAGCAFLALLKNEGLVLAFLLLAGWTALSGRTVRLGRGAAALLAFLPGLAWALASGAAGFPRADPARIVPESFELIAARIPIILPLIGKALVFSSCGPFFVVSLAVLALGLRKGSALRNRRAVLLVVVGFAEVGVLTWVYLTTPSNAVWLFWVSVERVLAPPTMLLLVALAAIGSEPEPPLVSDAPSS